MATTYTDLPAALAAAATRFDPAQLRAAAHRLIATYRDGVDPAGRVIDSELDAAAYAAYRMPATYAATHAALRAAAALAPGFRPATHVDVGGGTGAAVWAAAATWPSLGSATVLEQSPPAIELGRRLAGSAAAPAVRGARWRRVRVGADVDARGADLATMCYVLGELAAPARRDVVRSLAREAGMVVLVEPGTPAGYERVVAARELLLELGLSLVAPCPHEGECPIERGADWCHFATRLNRNALHRALKLGTRGFEDEKYAYVAATRHPWSRAANRVVRHPRKRGGLVTLELCRGAGDLGDETVARSAGASYRSARSVAWGDAWPPPDGTD